MTSISNVIEKLLSNINQLQKYITTPNSEDDKLVSVFLAEDMEKTSRFIPFEQQSKISREKDGMTEYSIPSVGHSLISSTLRQILPEISIKDEYVDTHRIAWVEKTLIYMIQEGQLYQDEEPRGVKITSEILNNYLEYFLNNTNQRETYESLRDMCEGSTQWDVKLERKAISFPQPFFYTIDILRGLKKYICNGEFSHRYTLRRKVSDILRMQEYIEGVGGAEGVWKDVNGDDIINRLNKSDDITPSGDLARSTEFWGYYTNINPVEKTDRNDYKQAGVHKEHTREFFQIEETDVKEKGVAKIELKEHIGAIRQIFWRIRNNNAYDQKDYFNYSFNNSSPIISSSLKLKEGHLWENYESDHHANRLPRLAGLRVPKQKGYNVHPFCYSGDFSVVHDSSVDLELNDGKLSISYSIPPGYTGKLIMIIEYHRIVKYEKGNVSILTQTSD